MVTSSRRDCCNLQHLEILIHFEIMKNQEKSNCVIRVDPATHRQAKILAASEGITLAALVALALDKELARRRRNEKNRRAAPE